jgi:hypothetical protein
MDTLQPQFRTEEWTFLLDGRVVETFYKGSAMSTRFHVDHLSINGEPDGAGLKVRWGILVGGIITNGGRAGIAPDDVAAFNDFVRMAVANRTPS